MARPNVLSLAPPCCFAASSERYALGTRAAGRASVRSLTLRSLLI